MVFYIPLWHSYTSSIHLYHSKHSPRLCVLLAVSSPYTGISSALYWSSDTLMHPYLGGHTQPRRPRFATPHMAWRWAPISIRIRFPHVFSVQRSLFNDVRR